MPSSLDSLEDISEANDGAAADLCSATPEIFEDAATLQWRTSPARGGKLASEFTCTHRLLRQLGNRWTFPIIEVLRYGPMRFARLKRTLDPVSQRMLTLSLRKLERDDLVYREEIAGQQPQVTYGLTPLGTALIDRLIEFEAWLAASRQILIPGRK